MSKGSDTKENIIYTKLYICTTQTFLMTIVFIGIIVAAN